MAIGDEQALGLIREALDVTIFAEAGAGTGKTSALVERFLALVLGGRKVERIVAITFTEKAAAELRDRVREGLERYRAERPEHAIALTEAVESLDRAQISTIHSFCHVLLLSFGPEAGIDPSFRVQDEVMADRRFEERWRSYLETLAGDDAAAAAVDRALGLGLTPRDLESLARGLATREELILVMNERPPGTPLPFWPDLKAMRDRLAELPLNVAPKTDNLRIRVERVAELLRDLLRAGDEREARLAAGVSILEQRFRVGSYQVWGSVATRDRVRETAKAICEQLAATLSACRAEALAALMPYIIRFVAEDGFARGREGILTFDDLILRVRDLLRGSADAVRSLRERYDVLLIDEFQDTDPLQVQIALAFATDPVTGKVDRGRLFLVGDPKQSIYRFRRADMAVYAQTRATIEAAGGLFPELAQNRRSRSVILDWVNRVFERMIGAGTNRSVQPPYRPVQKERDLHLNGPGVAWFGEQISDGRSAREIRRLESSAVAARCRAAVDERWQVQDRRTGNVRSATFGDIAILIPARTVLAAMERSLAEAAVPYRVEGGSLIYRTQEVRDLINCLSAIDDPADEVAVAGALRSTAFACSDVDLALHKAAGGSFNYLHGRLGNASGIVADALRLLARYHGRRHQGSLAALIEGFVAECGQVETGILDRGDRNTFRRMRFVVEQARSFEAPGRQSLGAFVKWLERRSSEVIIDNEGAGLDDDEEAVRVLTIHGAKGLEFPIVFMAGMGSPLNNRTETYTVDHDGKRLAIVVGAKSQGRRFTLGPVEDLEHLERAHAEAEFVRTLYVAATRARDHLVFSLYHKAGASKSGAALLIQSGAAEAAGPLPLSAGVRYRALGSFDGLTIDIAPQETVEDFLAERKALVEACRGQRFTSATAEVRESKEETQDAGEPWARGRGGTRLGRAVHAAIQSLPLDAGQAMIEAFSRAQAVAEAVPDQAAAAATLVRTALRSEAAQRARQALRALREVPFAVQFGQLTLEGFIDLVIETPEGIEIVDWKTDHVAPQEVRARLDEYSLQAGLYVVGVEAASGRPVLAVTYVFVSAGMEVSPGEPGVLATAAREHLRARGGEDTVQLRPR